MDDKEKLQTLISFGVPYYYIINCLMIDKDVRKCFMLDYDANGEKIDLHIKKLQEVFSDLKFNSYYYEFDKEAVYYVSKDVISQKEIKEMSSIKTGQLLGYPYTMDIFDPKVLKNINKCVFGFDCFCGIKGKDKLEFHIFSMKCDKFDRSCNKYIETLKLLLKLQNMINYLNTLSEKKFYVWYTFYENWNHRLKTTHEYYSSKDTTGIESVLYYHLMIILAKQLNSISKKLICL
jgi:hypothetical protein